MRICLCLQREKKTELADVDVVHFDLKTKRNVTMVLGLSNKVSCISCRQFILRHIKHVDIRSSVNLISSSV